MSGRICRSKGASARLNGVEAAEPSRAALTVGTPSMVVCSVCRPGLVALYRRWGFVEIAAPVWADQPDGRIEMPQAAMWRALRTGAEWPPGRVDVRGLPF